MNIVKTMLCLVLLLAVTLMSGCTCDNDDYLAKLEAANIATVRLLHAEMAKGNMDVFDENLTENYVRHCQAMPPELQEMHGAEQLKAFVGNFISAVSDFSETFDVITADSDMVAYVTTMSGTQTGTMGGLPPSGKQFTCVNIIIQRFEEGKIAETWVSWDNVAMLSQLGFFPPPAPGEKP